MSLLALPIDAAPRMLLDLPMDSTFGPALTALAVLMIGVGLVSLFRARRTTRTAALPTSAAF